MQIDPLLTCHPVTGAIRPITPSLLQETYLCPAAPVLDFDDTFGQPDFPWAESYRSAPQEVIRAATDSLVQVAKATPGMTVANLDVGNVTGRARTHLDAIKRAWEALEDGLPEDLWAVRHVFASSADSCIDALPLVSDAQDAFRTLDEIALAEHLKRHHGLSNHNTALRKRVTLDAPPPGKGTLGQVQRKLLKPDSSFQKDDTLAVHGLSNPFEEMEFAAALAQSFLDQGHVESPEDIGLLIPGENIYQNHLAHAFGEAGLSLSGLSSVREERDLCGELLTALLSILQGPVPRLALATLYRSPLMPWKPAVGQTMVRELMDRGFSRTARQQTGDAQTFLSALHPVTTANQLLARLGEIARALPGVDHREEFQARCNRIRSHLATRDELDWPAIKQAAAVSMTCQPVTERFVEGISVFEETVVPWRPVRKLIVLGFSGRQWPRTPSTNPFFTDSELAHIKETAGLSLFTRKQRLDRNLEVFRRQLCVASDSIDFLVPARDGFGQRMQASPGLSLVGRCLGQVKPEALIEDVRSASSSQLPCHHRVVKPAPNLGQPNLPSTGELRLGTDLFQLRLDEKGRPATQSPSRLEKLIVSPLAWLMDELGAKERIWAPEDVDPLVLGSVIHGVLERIFLPKQVPPSTDDIKRHLPKALNEAITKEAPFLSGSGWTIERAGLLHEAERACRAWSDFLHANNARVIENEIDLAGTAFGLRLFGRADCILQTENGQFVIVDHKRSGSARRREQMRKGWDLQVALYAAMLQSPEIEDGTEPVLPPGVSAATAYHLTLDHTVLLGGLSAPTLQQAEPVGLDISANALPCLSSEIKAAKIGRVRLNSAGDIERIERERGGKPYALLDNVFVGSFLIPTDDTEDATDV